MGQLDNAKVAFLLTDGFEDSELTSPWQAVVEEGATATLVSPKDGRGRTATRKPSTSAPLRPTPPTSTRSCCPEVS